MSKQLALFFYTVICLVGCGSANSPVAPAGENPVTSVTVSSAPLRVQHQGIVVDFGTTAFRQPTRVSLGSPEPAPAQPGNSRFRATGSYFSVDLGGSQVSGEITFTFPGSSENSEVDVFTSGFFVPLHNRVRHPDGSLSGSLNFTPGANFRVGLVDSDRRPVPHENWGSWNGYVFRPAPKSQGQPGRFEQIVFQGQLGPAGLPVLGDHPLLLVHGLGSSIQGKTFDALAQYLFEKEAATTILGFEYDSLDRIQSNGVFLRQALNLFAQDAPTPPPWNFVAHSMGTLVTRSAIEQPGPSVLPGPTGRAVLMCGPHLGSGVIDNLQGRNVLGDLLSILTINGQMDFRNRDGRVCTVANREAGTDDLRTDSPFLAALNLNASDHHPSTTYYTLAGGLRRRLLELCAGIFGLQFDDGVVNIPSANFAGLGQSKSDTLLADHLSVNLVRSDQNPEGDADISFPRVLEFLRER